MIVRWLTAQSWQCELVERGRLSAPIEDQRRLFTVLSWGLLLLDAVIALLGLRHGLAPLRGRGVGTKLRGGRRDTFRPVCRP